MNPFFWMVLNVGVSIIGPIFTLALIVPTHGWRVARVLIGGSVKDGQLFWCAIGLCAAAIYEAVTALERGRGETFMLALCIAGFCVVAFATSTVAMLVSVNTLYDRETGALRRRRAALASRRSTRAVVLLSAAITCLVASCFTALHVHLIQRFFR
ncbi:MAG TPA: hypothetical protein VFE79_09585 [Paraburkholderia sp.]|nr:hypothetical protein [Paraburkholderia sp.]